MFGLMKSHLPHTTLIRTYIKNLKKKVLGEECIINLRGVSCRFHNTE